jgi:hypothetical protein
LRLKPGFLPVQFVILVAPYIGLKNANKRRALPCFDPYISNMTAGDQAWEISNQFNNSLSADHYFTSEQHEGFITKMRNLLDSLVPVGFEDETGFHLRVMLRMNESVVKLTER